MTFKMNSGATRRQFLQVTASGIAVSGLGLGRAMAVNLRQQASGTEVLHWDAIEALADASPTDQG